MRLSLNLLPCLGLLLATLPGWATEPLAKLSVRNFGDLTNGIARIAASLNPREGAAAAPDFCRGLGLTNLATLDTQRPWEIAIWYEGGTNRPWVALKAPVGDVTRFKDSLSPEGVLLTQGKEWTQLSKGVALIVFREGQSLAGSEQSALDQWKAETVPAPAGLVELTLKLNEPLRAQLASLLGLAKMSVSQSMNATKTSTPPGFNPQAMGEILSTYFELVESFLTGLAEVRVGVDLDADAIVVRKRVTAKADTDLAKWLAKPTVALTAQELRHLDPDALFSFAGVVGKDTSFLKWIEKITLLGLQMQSGPTNETLAKDIEKLFGQMFPMALAGSVYLKDGISMVGVYRFPEAQVTEVYAQMKSLMTNMVKSQVGEDKIYSAATLVDKDHLIKGAPIDRLSLTINSNSPLLQMPGQKEQFEKFYPQGKLVLDYVLKDGQLLMASSDRMQKLLEASSAKSAGDANFKLDATTCLIGYMNLLGAIQQFVAANPMIPAEVKEKLAQLDPQGTRIEFEVSLDNRLQSRGRIPLKLLRELGRLKDN